MSAVIRIKRHISEEPQTAFILNCKKRKTDDSKQAAASVGSAETSTVLKFAGTVNQVSNRFVQLWTIWADSRFQHFRTRTSPSISQKSQKKKPKTSSTESDPRPTSRVASIRTAKSLSRIASRSSITLERWTTPPRRWPTRIKSWRLSTSKRTEQTQTHSRPHKRPLHLHKHHLTATSPTSHTYTTFTSQIRLRTPFSIPTLSTWMT